MAQPTLAIIGAGAAGLSCAYRLHKDFNITVFEKNTYIGGHANTVTVDYNGETVRLDTAFVVFNDPAYPLFNRLLHELHVSSMRCPMSFGFQIKPLGWEYITYGLTYCFCDWENLFNSRFLKMLLQMWRFHRQAHEVLKQDRYRAYSIAQYVQEKGYGEDFLNNFLIPLLAVTWSLPPKEMLAYPVFTLVQFLDNHGVLQGIFGRKRWMTVVGGSRSYVDTIAAPFQDKILLECAISRVALQEGKAVVRDTQGQTRIFDKLIFACHADQALRILQDPSPLHQEILSRFRYQPTRVIVHTDPALLPKNRRRWAGWNYLADYDANNNLATSFTYYLNRLQKVSTRSDFFVTINDTGKVNKTTILKEFYYEHPVFDLPAIKAQAELHRLNQAGPVYFCGSYFGYGFHEDAFRSGSEVCKALLESRSNNS
jgi:predicted NAD/FAD-binding protein